MPRSPQTAMTSMGDLVADLESRAEHRHGGSALPPEPRLTAPCCRRLVEPAAGDVRSSVAPGLGGRPVLLAAAAGAAAVASAIAVWASHAAGARQPAPAARPTSAVTASAEVAQVAPAAAPVGRAGLAGGAGPGLRHARRRPPSTVPVLGKPKKPAVSRGQTRGPAQGRSPPKGAIPARSSTLGSLTRPGAVASPSL